MICEMSIIQACDFPKRNRMTYGEEILESKNVSYENQDFFKPHGLWYGIHDSWLNNKMEDVVHTYYNFSLKGYKHLYEIKMDETNFIYDLSIFMDDSSNIIPKNKILIINETNYELFYNYIKYILVTISDCVKTTSGLTFFIPRKSINGTMSNNRYLIPEKYHSIWSYISQDFDGIEFVNHKIYKNKYDGNFDLVNKIYQMCLYTLDADSGCIWNTSIIQEFNKIV